MRYQDSLQLVSLSSCKGLTKPPVGFSFPKQLAYLAMDRCDIDDIVPFDFPESLEQLSLADNEFTAPEDYQWPKDCEVNL